MTSPTMSVQPHQSDRRTLLIDDGGPAALVACLLEPVPASISLWFDWRSSARSTRIDASRRRAELLGLHAIDFAPDGPVIDGPGAGADEARALMAAGVAAIRAGCDRIVWPVHRGEDITQMTAAGDRALAVERVLDLESDPELPPIRFDLPLLDLTLDQVADLAIDLDAPGEAAWWCELDAATPCASCQACLAWDAAIQRARFRGAAVLPPT